MQIGDKIPALLGTDQDGHEVKAADFEGRTLVLYFYPKDLTLGCTAEACSFRDHYETLLAKGYAVVGVSINDEKTHHRFIEKNSLPFPLIADTEHKLAETFGVWGEKKLYGRTYMGVLRTTFIIDGEGRITRIFQPKEIKTKIHAEQVLAEAGEV